MLAMNAHVSAFLIEQIYYSLDNNLLLNALFLATRLRAHEPDSTEASYLVSLCHLRLNQPGLAAEYSERFASEGLDLGCGFVFAQSCLGLGRFLEGIDALERNRQSWSRRTNHRLQMLPY